MKFQFGEYLFSNCLDFELSINADLESSNLFLYSSKIYIFQIVIRNNFNIYHPQHSFVNTSLIFQFYSPTSNFSPKKKTQIHSFSSLQNNPHFEEKSSLAISKKKGEAARTFNELSRVLNNYPNSV